LGTRNLSIGERLAVGLGILVVLVTAELAVVGASVRRLGELRAREDAVLAPRARLAERLERTVLNRAIALRNYVLTGDRAIRAAADEEMRRAREAIAALRALPEEADRPLSRLVPLVDAYERVGNEFADAIASPDVLSREQASAAARAALAQAVREYAARQHGEVAAAKAEIAAAEARLRASIAWFAAALILGFAASAYWVVRSVRAPVRHLARVARALAAGRADEALALAEGAPPATRDEVSQLGWSFGLMARELVAREERLQAQNEELQSQAEELQSQTEELQAQQEELQAQQEELHVQAEDLRAQNDRLRVSTEALADADRRKDEFLATLGHELRNPLAAVATAAQLIEARREDPAAVGRAGAVVTRQTRHLARLVDDLLDVSRITRGKIQLRRERVDLRDALRNAAEACRSVLEQRRQELAIETGNAPAPVDGDPARLEQIAQNLLHNASKFSAPGARVRAAVSVEGGEAVLRVQDPGEGIAPELLPRIFDLFVQGDASGTTGGGLGIGLTLVRELAALHGGRVAAESPGKGQGATFTVRLPLASRRVTDLAVPAAPGPRPGKLRVLLVEDNADLAETTTTLLAMWGHDARAVSTGRAALAAVDADRPDVVLLDIGLPDMTGYDVARAIRSRGDGAGGVKLVALTGYGLATDRERAAAAGFDAHLVKPTDPDALQATLASLAGAVRAAVS
jgi:signal transduction histidine kinase/ActR/RegA family two-component response regulator